MRNAVRLGVVLTALAISSMAYAQPRDPAAARELLKQGFALKQAGKHAEALPRLLESVRLDPQIKALLNLADCEEHLGKLVDASQHFLAARDKAGRDAEKALEEEARARLLALEALMPRLTITIAASAPPGTEVERDGVVLGGPSFGVALPSDPGKRIVIVRAAGYEDRSYEVVLAERDKKDLEVMPGPKRADASAPAPIETQPRTAAPAAGESPADAPSNGRTQRIIGLGAAGLGVAALVFSGIEWLAANGKHDDAVAKCNPGCGDDARSLQDDAQSAATLSVIAGITGVVLVSGGAVLFFTAAKATATTPTNEAPVARLKIAPIAGPHVQGVSFGGVF